MERAILEMTDRALELMRSRLSLMCSELKDHRATIERRLRAAADAVKDIEREMERRRNNNAAH